MLEDLVRALGEANLAIYALAFGLYYLGLLLSSLKLKIILRNLGQEVGFGFLFKLSILAVFVNNLTPMARYGGEPTKIFLLKDEKKIPLGIATTAVITEKAIDAIPFIAFLLYAAIFVGLRFSGFVFAFSLLIAVLATFFIVFQRRIIEMGIRKWGERIPGDSMAEYDKALRMLREKWPNYILVAAISLLIIILIGIRIGFLAMSMSYFLSWPMIVYVIIVYVVLGTIGLTPGGVGILDGGLLAVLVSIGIPAAPSAAIVILERSISYISTTILGAVIASHYGGLRLLRLWRGSTEK